MKQLASLLLLATLIFLGSGIDSAQAAPNAQFSFEPFDPDINTTVTFDASDSSSSGRFIDTYEWDFDGDGIYEFSTEESTSTHLFSQSGNLIISLRVTDSSGDQEVISQSVSILSASVLIRREIIAPIEPNRVTAGSAFQVKITIEFLEDVNAPGFRESWPENWRVGSVDAANATFKAPNEWIWLGRVEEGVVQEITYNVTVASGTASGSYESAGSFSFFRGVERIQIDIPGDAAVRVI